MKTKYPRTFHLPWSQGRSDDDKVLKSIEHFQGKQVVVTVKMDGENTSLYHDGYSHARSIDSANHESRNWVKRWWQERCYELPEGWRVCGENLYARHSIAYDDLPSYFMGFSIWGDDGYCRSWLETLEWFQEILDIEPVRTIWEGVFDEDQIRNLESRLDPSKDEGYVVRLAQDFNYNEFGTSVAKWVRKDHVATEKHWMHSQVIPNKLAEK